MGRARAVAGIFGAERERHGPRVLRRFVFAEHGPAFWARLWIVAAVAEFAALVPVVFDTGRELRGLDVIFILAAGSFIACGLVAWRRRPDNHSGRLMTATGFAGLAYPLLSQLDWALAATAALLLYSVWTIGYVALLLTFQTGGRIQSPVDGLLVGAFALSLLVLQFVWMLFLEADGNVLTIAGDARVADAIDQGRRWLTAATSLAVALVIAARWRAASGPRRRALLPGIVGGVSGLLYTALLVDGLVADRPSDLLWWLANSALLLVPAAYLGGLLRSRLARAGLAPLLLELRTMRGEKLQAALARTVGDPHLELVSAGAPRPSDGRSIAVIERDGHHVADLVYDASLDDDPELIEAVSAAAAMALENERLHEESQARMAELRASRQRLVAASDEERRRLERNLHDGAQQRLVAVALQLQLIQRRVRDDPGLAEELATSAAEELKLSLEELRELARGLHPPVLDRGLEAAVRAAATRSPVPTTVSSEVPRHLPQPVELAAYFVASEALANVAKYAQAGAVEVRLAIEGTNLVTEIADDGIGGASPNGGSGLRGLADRVEALGGRLNVQSAPGAGTVVSAELPLEGDRLSEVP
jgi:signal transduction histidine kinase